MEKSFSQKSYNILELNAVLTLLSNEAVCDTAKEAALHLSPSTNKDEVSIWLNETSAACSMMVVKGSPSFGGIKDVRPSLERAVLGGSLNTRELLQIAGVIRSARLVKSYASDDPVGKTSIDYLFNALHSNRFLEDSITTSIVSEDEIADSASTDLTDIRRKMRAASSRAREALSKIISSPSYAKALQENIITMRSDRYVVPVKAEYRGEIPGLVHDVSASGATLFVEPMAAVKANNELRELIAKEKIEIEKILSELSAACAEHKMDIDSDYTILTRLDLLFAKAKLSYKLDCSAATISEHEILLRHARHPLLDKKTAVPIDVELGKDFDALIITGPNTGGKTVTLKTVGLLAAMNQCGMHIPADDGSSLPIFTHILADIGDEQSIEQSLSTFSSHMSNIISILDECDEQSLVLFDELGAGTDPAEGAALAVSIIEKIRKRGALIVATTHYTELKVYATNEKRVQNASCEFDVETLKPTYRLLIGIPGKSNAFAISERLGLDKSIIEDARTRIGADNADFESTIEKLEQTRLALEDKIKQADEKLRNAQEKDKKSSMLKAELEVRLEKANIKAAREAEEIIKQARKTAEDVFDELDEMKAKINEEQSSNEINDARNELRRKLNLAESGLRRSEVFADDRKSSREIRVGDYVEVKSMGVKGEVSEKSSDKTLKIKSGILVISVKEDDVLLLDNYKRETVKNTAVSRGTSQIRTESTKAEIDLRGLESIEAVNAAELYLDNALMSKLSPVTIIHGKGTGALRTAIHQMLKRNRIVKSYRLGTFGEGESGVTIVELKIK